MNLIRRAFATVGRITEALIPNQLMLADRAASWPDALTDAEEQSEVLEPSDFPGCNCTGAQAADLADHRPACAARAAGDSPAAVSDPPTPPAAGRRLHQIDRAASVIRTATDAHPIAALTAARQVVEMLAADVRVETGHDIGLSAASEFFPQHTKK